MKKIDLKGRIIPQANKWLFNWFGIPSTSAEDISQALKEANGDDIEIYVNSQGGSVYDGYEIYNMIREYSGNVTFKIVGLAASAASFVCMAGGKCLMSPLSQMMIHNASTSADGPHQTMDSTSNMLQITDHTIAQAYVIKSGKTENEIRNIMENETWLSANQCKDLGLIDGLMFEDDSAKEDINPAPTIYNFVNDDSFMNTLTQCASKDEVKKMVMENMNNFFKDSNSNQPILENSSESNIDDNIKNNAQEESNMDVNTLKNEHKDVYDQIVNDATKAERERIKAIEDLALPGNEDILNKAKFETGVSAEAVAVQIIQNQKSRGAEYLQSLKDDAETSKVNDVKSTEVPDNNSYDSVEDETSSKFMSDYMNSLRGGK